MQNGIKLFLSILFAFIYINATGQTLIVKGGLNLSKISYKGMYDDTYVSPVGFRPGFNLGVAYEDAISDKFFVEAGPMLQMKGSKFIHNDTRSVTTLYLDMPIMLKGYFELSEKISFYTSTGIYLGVGIFGETKSSYVEEIPWGENEWYGLSRYDFGLSLGGGFDYRGMQIGFAYDFSLIDISTDVNFGGELKNNVMRFSFGYKFVKNRQSDDGK